MIEGFPMLFAERLVHQPLTRKPDSSEVAERLQSTHRFDKLKRGQRFGVTSCSAASETISHFGFLMK